MDVTSVDVDTTDVLFYCGNNSRPCRGLLLGKIGNRMFHVLDRDDGSVHRRHREQIEMATHPESESEEKEMLPNEKREIIPNPEKGKLGSEDPIHSPSPLPDESMEEDNLPRRSTSDQASSTV